MLPSAWIMEQSSALHKPLTGTVSLSPSLSKTVRITRMTGHHMPECSSIRRHPRLRLEPPASSSKGPYVLPCTTTCQAGAYSHLFREFHSLDPVLYPSCLASSVSDFEQPVNLRKKMPKSPDKEPGNLRHCWRLCSSESDFSGRKS